MNMKITVFLKMLCAVLMCHSLSGYHVGLCVVATGKYIGFVDELIASARTHFLKNHEVTYFVFTDGVLKPAADVVQIYQVKLGWPYDSLMRFAVYANHKEELKNMDYIFACDADMLFVDTIEDYILGSCVGTKHPINIGGNRGDYETNPASVACVRPDEGQFYFAGAFYGAKRDEFFKMMDILTKSVETDLKNNVMAKWHDESHLNRYFIDHKPLFALPPQFCCFEGWKIPARKLLARSKENCDAIRA